MKERPWSSVKQNTLCTVHSCIYKTNHRNCSQETHRGLDAPTGWSRWHLFDDLWKCSRCWPKLARRQPELCTNTHHSHNIWARWLKSSTVTINKINRQVTVRMPPPARSSCGGSLLCRRTSGPSINEFTNIGKEINESVRCSLIQFNAIFEADQHQTIKSSGNSRLSKWIFVETNIVKTSGRLKFTIDWKPFASCKTIHKNLLHASQLSSIEWQGTSCWQLSSRPEWGPPPPSSCFLRCSDQSSIDLNCAKL